jgi:hypothetical protein
MTRTWTKHVEAGTGKAIRNPFLFSFTAVFVSFIAGVELIWLVQSGAPRSFVHGVLDYSVVVFFLVFALDASFMLARAIRKLHNNSSPSSVPIGKGA